VTVERPRFDADQALAVELETITDLESLRDEWTRLAIATRNVFATWEWNTTWWKHFGKPGRLLVTTCRAADGRLVAILPLYLWRTFPLRVVRFLGHRGADELGPICAPEDRDVVARALLEALARAGAQVFVGERLPAGDGWQARFGARVLAEEASPTLRFPSGDWETFLRSKSSNFRGQVRQRERRLFRDFDACYRLATDPGRLHDDVGTLFALHVARWSKGATDFQSREAFHREFAAQALERGWLRLWFLEVDGVARAADYGFRFADVESYYQGGRDPDWNAHSVGFVLMLHAIRTAFGDGMREFRLLRGGEDYKYRLATEDDGLETVGVTRGAIGSGALSLVVAARRSRVGRWLRG
jgi:CelD/BcsL family acetyltransferase involved in cellulose biosynthesis